MPSSEHAFESMFLYTTLRSAVADALTGNSHHDRVLLLLFQRLYDEEQSAAVALRRLSAQEREDRKETDRQRRQDVLKLVVGTPAQTPLGIAVKLAVACDLDACFRAVQEQCFAEIVGSHAIISAFFDALLQADLLPLEQPKGPYRQ